MSLEYTYADPPLRTKKEPAEYRVPSPAMWLCLAVSVLAAAQSVYFDVRAHNNYAASSALHGTLSLLEQRRREEIADFDHVTGKLNELLTIHEKEKMQ